MPFNNACLGPQAVFPLCNLFLLHYHPRKVATYAFSFIPHKFRFEVYPFYIFSPETAETPPVSSPPDATVRTSPPVSSVTGKKIQNGNSYCSYWNSCSCCSCAPVSYLLLPA